MVRQEKAASEPVPQASPAARRELNRQAWWAWLGCPDDALAERIAEYFDGLPAWLDSRPWFAIGLVAGVPFAILTAALVPAAAAVEARFAAALAVWLFCGFALARREAWTEQAAHFTARVAVTVLHLPYLILAVVSAAAWVPPGPLKGSTRALVAVAAAGLVIPFVRLTSPRVLVSPDFDNVWPSIAGLPSLALRTVTLFAAGFVWVPLVPDGWDVALVIALLTVLGTSWVQDRLAGALAARLRGRLGPRARRWPARFRSAPFAFEAALLAVDDSPAARELAATYADFRDYQAEELDAALCRLGSLTPSDVARAHAAALCALELWANPRSTPEEAYRGYARLDAVARRCGAALDLSFWGRFADLTAGRHLHAEGLRWLLEARAAIGLTERETWQRLVRLRWIEALEYAAPHERSALIASVLELQREIGDPGLLHVALSELETLAFEAGGAPLPAELRAAALAVCDDVAPAEPTGLRSSNHPAYPIDLRRLAYRAAAGGDSAEWYAAARRFEALPRSRQAGLLAPAVYASFWTAVLQAVDDLEEAHRQRERYRQDARRGAG